MSVLSAVGRFVVPVGRPRESGMELLRIVAMSMILCGHFMTHGLAHTVRNTQLYFILEPLFICGVNLFFLISGWYGIRFSLKGFVKIIVLTAFFVAVNLILCVTAGVDIGWKTVTDLFLFPVSRSGYWFMMVYTALLIVAPILNSAMRHMERRQFIAVVILLTFFNCYSCAIGGNYVSYNGYSFMQGVWLYCVAALLRHYEPLFLSVRPWVYILLFMAFTGCNMYWHRFEYNSVLVAVPSVALFFAFAHLRFRNKAVNSIASASLGTYLLQDGMFGRSFLYRRIEENYRHLGQMPDCGAPVRMVLYLAVMFIIIWVASWLLTPVANRIGDWVAGILDSLNRTLRKYFADPKGFITRKARNPHL